MYVKFDLTKLITLISKISIFQDAIRIGAQTALGTHGLQGH